MKALAVSRARQSVCRSFRSSRMYRPQSPRQILTLGRHGFNRAEAAIAHRHSEGERDAVQSREVEESLLLSGVVQTSLMARMRVSLTVKIV